MGIPEPEPYRVSCFFLDDVALTNFGFGCEAKTTSNKAGPKQVIVKARTKIGVNGIAAQRGKW
jgi:hypothetical protein